jgi:tetratricopeptide (TPR) repeat protein
LGGVAELLGESATSEVEADLDRLVREELLAGVAAEPFAGERAFAFRQAVVRDAAYAMLTETDLRTGHALAGAWLLGAGATDPLVLAEHFERGGAFQRAGAQYARAATLALEANDFARALACVKRAEACAPENATGELCLVASEAHKWRGENKELRDRAQAAMAALPRGTDAWAIAAMEVAGASVRLADAALVVSTGEDLLRVVNEVVPTGVLVSSIALTGRAAFMVGADELGDRLLASIESVVVDRFAEDANVLADVGVARSLEALKRGDVERAFAAVSAAARDYEAAGDLRSACAARLNAGGSLGRLGGAPGEASSILHEALETAERMGLATLTGACLLNLGRMLGLDGKVDEGVALELRAAAMFREQGNVRLLVAAQVYLAMLELSGGRAERGEAAAREAVRLAERLPAMQCHVYAALSSCLLALGRVTESLEVAELSAARLKELQSLEEGEALVWLATVEARFAAGDPEGARAALLQARDWLLGCASRIRDPKRRTEFWTIPEHAALLAYVRAEGLSGDGIAD